MLHPDTWSALADHSGDALFEFCYVMDFPKALAAFRRRGGPAKWLRWYWRGADPRRGGVVPNLDKIGMGGPQSPQPPGKGTGGGFSFHPRTGRVGPRASA